MNENIDLTKILKDCPKGWEFYSSIYGEVKFETIKFQCLKYRYDPHTPVHCHCQIVEEDPRPIKFTVQDVERCVSSAGEHIKGKGECTFFPSKDQRDWSKFSAPWYKDEKKLVKPKFKVGDKIVSIIIKYMGASGTQGTILKITDDKYIFTDGSCMSISNQDSWELVSDKKPKFDPKTLQPFDKVLVRDGSEYNWMCSLFSCIQIGKEHFKYWTVSACFECCIPYNDDTKHLVGTNEEAPEYYKYWED